MSAAVTGLAIQAGKMAGRFLLEEYGDDALCAFAGFVKRHGKGADAQAGIAVEDGIRELLVELNRPFDEFFGPRIGA